MKRNRTLEIVIKIILVGAAMGFLEWVNPGGDFVARFLALSAIAAAEEGCRRK
jgi:hypothetical protein